MTETVKRRISDEEVERIPWKEYIRNQFRKIVAFIILLVMLGFIIRLSYAINQDPDLINPEQVILLRTWDHVLLMLLSSILFISVLAIFTRVVLVDHKEEFGIQSWRDRRVIGTFFLTTSFITLVYILLDISLINIYLMTLPSWLVWNIQFVSPVLDNLLPNTVDRLAYAQIRGYIFVAFLVFIFIFPLSMFISILTRFGRKTIKDRREKEKKLPMGKIVLGFVVSGVITIISLTVFNNFNEELLGAIFLFVALISGFSAGIFLLLIIINVIRFGIFVSYSNILLIFPIIFLFYLLPAALWAIWDLIYMLTTNSDSNTIYEFLKISPQIDFSVTDITTLTSVELARFFLQTLGYNLSFGAAGRLIQLDFVIVVGLAALIIGFAEGYSILAIFRSISKGISIARTGKVASRSAPRIMVITTRMFYLMTWLSFFWDNLITLLNGVSVTFNITLPLIELPQIFTFVLNWAIDLSSLTDWVVILTILAVPFYFILTSAFKFLSVSLALERVKEDKQYYYLLISSAYILIVTNIFADITALPEFMGDHKQFLPLAGAATQNLVPFVAKIFEFLESLGFYTGVVFVILQQIKQRIMRKRGEEDEEEIQHRIQTGEQETKEFPDDETEAGDLAELSS